MDLVLKKKLLVSHFLGQYKETGCFVMGWGTDRFMVNEYQQTMRKVKLPIVHNDECETKLRRTRLPDKFKLHDSFICAG